MDMRYAYQVFNFFFMIAKNVFSQVVLILKQPARKRQLVQHCCHCTTQHGTAPFGTYLEPVGNALNICLDGKAPIFEVS